MSICAGCGCFNRLYQRIRSAHNYHRFKDEVEETLLAIPSVGERLHHAAKTMKDAIAAAVLPARSSVSLVSSISATSMATIRVRWWPRYAKPQQIKDGPVIVHALTTKGKGHPQAEKDYYRWHATGPSTCRAAKPSSRKRALRPIRLYLETHCRVDEKDEKIIALTAAMPDGTGVCTALERFPDRSFDVGIAEQHCVTFAAGMSCEGLKPVCAIYSTFLQRGFDQLNPRRLYSELNVKFCLDRGGVAGGDGPTHHGLLDIAYLRACQTSQ